MDAPFTPECVQTLDQPVQGIAAFQRRKGLPRSSTVKKTLDSASFPSSSSHILNSMPLCQVAVTIFPFSPGVGKNSFHIALGESNQPSIKQQLRIPWLLDR